MTSRTDSKSLASDAPDDEAHAPDEAHTPGALGYLAVWLALIALATITLLASRAIGGRWGLVLAFAIAATKAGLVVAYFMHLRGGRSIHRVVLAIAAGFLLLLVGGVLGDVMMRSTASAYVDDRGASP